MGSNIEKITIFKGKQKLFRNLMVAAIIFWSTVFMEFEPNKIVANGRRAINTKALIFLYKMNIYETQQMQFNFEMMKIKIYVFNIYFSI